MKHHSRKKKEQSGKRSLPTWLSKATSGFYPIVIIAILGTAIYSNTFDSSFHFDDQISIVSNQSIQDVTDIHAIWDFAPTRFITYLSFAINYHFHQLEVFGYHFTNLAIHLGSAMLAWWLILLTLSTPAMKGQGITRHAKTIAFLGALIFVAHPLQTQAVTYIVQRAASLATFFYLASVSLYVRAKLAQDERAKRIVWIGLYGGSVAAGLLGMLTKEIVFSLPLVILLYEFYFLRGQRKLGFMFVTIFVVVLLVAPLVLLLSNLLPLAETTTIPRMHYLLTQYRVQVTYLRLLFLPINQTLDYSFPISTSLLEIRTLGAFLLLISLLISGIRLFSNHRLLSFSIFWFFLTLLPESSVIPIKDVIFEHRTYLPMFGFSLFLVAMSHHLLEHKGPRLMLAVSFILLVYYSVSAYERNMVWKDEITLWNDVVEKSPNNARAYNNRGNIYAKKGDYVRALIDFDQAVRIDPRFGDAYNNRGNVHLFQRQYKKALVDFTRALKVNPSSLPNLAIVYYNRGTAYLHGGDYEKAIDDFSQALSIDPNYQAAYSNRGVILSKMGKYDKAISDFTLALKIDPRDSEAYNNRGLTFFNQGEYQKAISDYDEALRINPMYAQTYLNRADAYYARKEYDRAREDIQKVQSLGLRVDPSFLQRLREASGK